MSIFFIVRSCNSSFYLNTEDNLVLNSSLKHCASNIGRHMHWFWVSQFTKFKRRQSLSKRGLTNLIKQASTPPSLCVLISVIFIICTDTVIEAHGTE